LPQSEFPSHSRTSQFRMKSNFGMLYIRADDVHRLPPSGLHDGKNAEAVRHEILSGADARRVAGEGADQVGLASRGSGGGCPERC
jgi:hypothetical protein